MNDSDLDQLLSTLDVAVEATTICEIERGVRVVVEPSGTIEVHYVLDGTMHLTVSGSPPLACRAGSLVIVPSGAPHSFAADINPDRDLRGADRCSAAGDGLQLCDAAHGRPGDLRLFCGFIAPSTSRSVGLLDRVIAPIVMDLSDAPIVRQAFAAMLNEIESPRLGTRAVVGTLMKICLVKAIQGHLSTPESRKLLLACLRAPHLQKVVAEVRAKPGAAYDLETLADISGMSRSAFAREFVKNYGMTPMRFVTITRLHRAAELLRCTAMPVKTVAGVVGFASRSHFSRAFRAVYGIDPLNFRTATELLLSLPC
ncbi:AraC family transcriptional regulator [Bradyrhizobium lablabi]|uniref:AraC family transcriptional regulator n=1 Tax=Bradyrhizobium lablabi TaxID=722472 RepID=UPI001BA63E8C|nr:AraC family transcriptional regulator [Bradyrhizobium lablabi]MBR0693072.1 helix-turn-helix transcriptional regulator [Bradyrhizobium lablabi]